MKIGLIHLGRTAAGPLLLKEMTLALRRIGHSTIVAYSSDAEIAHELGAAADKTVSIRTFSSAIGAIAGMARIPRIRKQITTAFDEFGVDAVVVPMEQVWQALMAPAIARRYDVLLVVHDGTMHDGEHSSLGTWLRNRERGAAAGAIVLSNHVEQELVRSGRFATGSITRTRLPAFSVSIQRAPRRLPDARPPRIGFFGRMARYKGLDLGLLAIDLVRKEGRRVDFCVVGDEVASDLPLLTHPDTTVEDRWVPQDEVEDVLDQFDVILLPYTEASQSGVLAYAMALGIPVVVTPVGGLAEQAKETGCALVADEVTADAVARAIDRVLSDGDLYTRLSAAGLAKAKAEFSWDTVAEDVIGAVESVRR